MFTVHRAGPGACLIVHTKWAEGTEGRGVWAGLESEGHGEWEEKSIPVQQLALPGQLPRGHGALSLN